PELLDAGDVRERHALAAARQRGEEALAGRLVELVLGMRHEVDAVDVQRAREQKLRVETRAVAHRAEHVNGVLERCIDPHRAKCRLCTVRSFRDRDNCVEPAGRRVERGTAPVKGVLRWRPAGNRVPWQPGRRPSTRPMNVYSNVLEMVGRTPMLELTRLDTGPCRLFLKLEFMNPGGSIKDRIGVTMIEEAERRGDLKPGDTIVEATAGNTGLGLALAAAQKGYRLVLVLPDKMSQEKIFNLRAMGAEIVLTRSDVAKGHPEYYQDLGQRIA